MYCIGEDTDQISYAITAQLICIFVFFICKKPLFSHDGAQWTDGQVEFYVFSFVGIWTILVWHSPKQVYMK